MIDRPWFAEKVQKAIDAEVERLRAVNAEARYLIDQLDCLAVESHPSLYARAQRWKSANAEGHL